MNNVQIWEKEQEEKMEFINKFCQAEYERLRKENPDLGGINHPLINISDVLKAYFALADFFTDPASGNEETMLIGLRSVDLLCSALGRQMTSFGGKAKYTNPIDICSTLFFGLVKDHAFSDGNKRTSLLVLLYQLWLYNYYPVASIKEFEKLVVATAAGSLKQRYEFVWKKYKNEDDPEVKTIAHILRKNTVKKDHTYHISITVRKFVDTLQKHSVSYSIDGGKIHFERKISHRFFQKPECYKYTVTFGGWTRTIGASTARDLLNNLHLYDQFPSYQSFVDGNEAFYSYIQEFEGPLRRLKDE